MAGALAVCCCPIQVVNAAGVITTPDRRFADDVLVELRRDRSLVVGDNEPYSAKDNVDYTIRRHGFDRGLANVMIEIRNDLVANKAHIDDWADRLTRALEASVRRNGTAHAVSGAYG